MEEGVMGKTRTGQRSAVRDLRTRRLSTSQAGKITGGLITETTIPNVRHSKNEVAVESLEIAHAGLKK
jgi:hypothetical protein